MTRIRKSMLVLALAALVAACGPFKLGGRTVTVNVTPQDIANATSCYAQVSVLVPIVRAQVLACRDAALNVRLGEDLDPVSIANVAACAAEVSRLASSARENVNGCEALVRGLSGAVAIAKQ